ncbi:hypothetical protein [Pandoraea sp. ISTKB]|uniref:hypothetical protein n=1 Tax=Pandoraea sp. ISTKB TaxID=1586708 RepID=UPI0008477F15|nr:hypothetical protein [Pandoraea sp. ISTKB]ODP31553.1 hypothetical protein A9762_06025 [Pandoraea sp. ISTKB]
MSRSGYSDDCEGLGLYRGRVASAIRGKRGQQALRELADALDAMPEKVLAADSLINVDGEFCTLGVLGNARGLNMTPLDPEDPDAVAKAFNIAPAMAREIVYENDESLYPWDWVEVEVCGPLRRCDRRMITVRVDIDPELLARARWQHMRKWVTDNLRHGAPSKENLNA